MTYSRATLYAQLAFVFDRDAAKARHLCRCRQRDCEDCAWPARRPAPTVQEHAEADRLEHVGHDLWQKACELGFSGGTDAAFDGGVKP